MTSAAMTAGFVAVFGAFGLLAAPLATVAHRVLPWVTIAVGLAVAVVGALLVAGRSIHLTLPVVATRARLSAVGFGMAFALASLSCTIGPFLALVTAGFRTRSVAEGIGAYLAYALGMGAVIAVVSVIVALARTELLRSARRALPLISRLAGALTLVSGLYVAWYGWYSWRVLYGAADPSDPVVDSAVSVQQTLAGLVAGIPSGLWLTLLAATIAAAGAVGVRSVLRRGRQDRGT